MEKLIIPIILVSTFFIITFLFVKWLNQKAKPESVSNLTYKFGVNWNSKKKPHCKNCLKKLEPHLSCQMQPKYQVFEIECIHCQTVHLININGVKADYYNILNDV